MSFFLTSESVRNEFWFAYFFPTFCFNYISYHYKFELLFRGFWTRRKMLPFNTHLLCFARDHCYCGIPFVNLLYFEVFYSLEINEVCKFVDFYICLQSCFQNCWSLQAVLPKLSHFPILLTCLWSLKIFTVYFLITTTRNVSIPVLLNAATAHSNGEHTAPMRGIRFFSWAPRSSFSD